MGSGGARPNAGRKKKNTEALQIRVAPEVAEAIRKHAKSHNVTLAEAVVAVVGSGIF